MKGIGSIPLSPVDGYLVPRFERISLMDIEDTFSGIADSLEHLAGVVSELREHSYQANRRGNKTQEQYAMDRCRYESEGETLLPLIQAQLEMVTLTARALAAGIDETMRTHPQYVILDERR